MHSPSGSTNKGESLFIIPSEWDADPLTQLRTLHDEVHRQKDYPGADTRAFMAAALQAIVRLPESCLAPEKSQTLMGISRFYYLDGEVDQAIQTASDAIQAAIVGGHRHLEGHARTRLGISLRGAYDFVGSISELATALEIARDAGDATSEAKVLNSLGNTYCDAGLYEEALAIFERVAAFFQERNDTLSAWMALDNAALAALRLGDVQRGTALAQQAREAWSGEARTADEHLWVVQGAITNCQLLIKSDRAEEAVSCAHAAQAIAAASGLGAAESFATLAEAISTFATGKSGIDAIERVIATARDCSPNMHWCALDAAVRVFEHSGQYDRALSLQKELLALCVAQKFDQVRRTWGRPSFEEGAGPAMLAQLGKAVDRKLTDLVNTAITQALRAGHDNARIFRVSRLAELFTTSQGWPSAQARSIGLAAKLIDIGMIVIPDDLLRKSRGLSEGERKIVAEHAKFGAEVLASAKLGLLEPCIPVVRSHHERWDGTGPAGLARESIPLGARVIALCDSFDAMTHDRPWRRAFSLSTAMQVIRDGAGSQFDPVLTESFVDWMQRDLLMVDDIEAHLAVEAAENGYVQMRERIQQLLRAAP
jgi:putative two-component system response regulator